MKRIEFFMPMMPPTMTFQDKQLAITRGKGGKPRPVMFDSPELKAVKRKLRDHLGPHAPDTPFEGPVRVVSKWCWPCEGTEHVSGEYRIDEPDADNLGKTLHDVMEDLGFFENDSQVMPVPETFWADTPGIWVSVFELPDVARRSA
jgi:Holliday junction resolvase RusA-like endonuclease